MRVLETFRQRLQECTDLEKVFVACRYRDIGKDCKLEYADKGAFLIPGSFRVPKGSDCSMIMRVRVAVWSTCPSNPYDHWFSDMDGSGHANMVEAFDLFDEVRKVLGGWHWTFIQGLAPQCDDCRVMFVGDFEFSCGGNQHGISTSGG